MGLGWHSPSQAPQETSGSAPATDPALLDALALIAQRIQELSTVVSNLNVGGAVLPTCAVVSTTSLVVVDSLGRQVVADCSAQQALVVDSQLNQVISSTGALVVYETPDEVLSLAGNLVVNQAGLPVVATVQ